MTFPSFVQTREASIGTAALLISSDLLVIQVSITPSRGLVWDATGDRFEASTWTTEGNLGESITMTLPCTDVAGWRDSVTGALIDVSAPDPYTPTRHHSVPRLDQALHWQACDPLALCAPQGRRAPRWTWTSCYQCPELRVGRCSYQTPGQRS